MARLALTRRNLVYALVALSLLALAVELALVLPRALEWHPWDYGNYVEMGNAVRQGLNPYGPHRFYPLPTMLWIFVPLSLLPDWFRIVWILFPFVFLMILFRSQVTVLLLYPPLWFVTSDALFDGWLLIPLAWLFANRPILAGFGAALLLFKPHATVLAVIYMTLWWGMTRDWRNLATFLGTLCVLWLPSFVVNPVWPLQMLAVLQTRVDYVSILPLLTVSVWSWWWLDSLWRLAVFAMLLAGGILFWRAIQRPANRAAAVQLLGLLINPVMLASNLITVLPTLRGQNQILAIVLVSLGAFVLDRAVGGFGGGYAFIPLAALYFQARQPQAGTDSKPV